MEFKEHNLRKEAKKFAEYTTGVELRKYTAEKIKKYLGNDPITIFDGAIGSGQLEHFLNIKKLYGIDIQEKSVETARQNFKEKAEIYNMSFFAYKEQLEVDCVVMNPPFSLKIKDLPVEEQEKITAEFNWKKSGVVDDIFVLKSLKYTKRYAFYILYPGVGYRKTESKLRELVGTQLAELNTISNAFEDTNIAVIFLVIDKAKTDYKVSRELYDCKKKSILNSDEIDLQEEEFKWNTINEKKVEEEIDIYQVSSEADEAFLKRIDATLEFIYFGNQIVKTSDIDGILKAIKKICSKWEKKIKEECEMTTEEKLEKISVTQLKLFNL